MKGSIVVVEDDKRLLNNLVKIFELKGFEVEGAHSVSEFHECIEHKTFDVAIVDIGLPDRSGFEVVEYLRNNTQYGIIVLTARETIKDKIKGYDSGADHYFVKPVDHRELTAVVNNLLSRKTDTAPLKKIESKWILKPQLWALISPKGDHITLTKRELIFLEHLTKENGIPVTRAVLLEALGYSADNSYDNKALDAAVVRLRKKIRDITSADAPIRTSHGIGYYFADSIKVLKVDS